MPLEKIPVYLMPGMAASPTIFENIYLPPDRFEVHVLDWFIPDRGMTLRAYAQKMCAMVAHPAPVLLGVSFGGMLVQEMAKLIPARKVVIVSSVKSRSELPKRMIFAKYTKVHKLLPTGLVHNVERLPNYSYGRPVTKRLLH